MNNQSPLVPQGSLLEQKNQGRARVKIAVFVVLGIHGIGLLALLMQGCKKESDATLQQTDQTNNPAMAFVEPTNTISGGSNELAQFSTNLVVPPDTMSQTPPPAPTPGPAPAPTASEYKVAKGDSLGSIAKKFHVTIKALTDANPGVEPTKLQIGQALHIPAPTVGATGGTAAPPVSSGSSQVYSVKSGDNLIKIAGQFGTTVKAIRSANSLTTDKIVVGQKLKIPVKAATVATPTNPVGGVTTTAAISAPVSAPTLR
jgi:LysM repeat protein